MLIDVQCLPSPPAANHLSNRAVVVVDVLRSTSVMVYALSEGAKEIIPARTIEEAFQMAKAFPPNSTLLGGEMKSSKIEGFDLGNSPKEYGAGRVKGKRLILATTNGTKAFHLVSSAPHILVGSFFNIGATAQRCLGLNKDLLIFPSGNDGNFSLEDTVCGGMLIHQIVKKRKMDVALTDASHSAYILYQKFEANLIEAFQLSRHGKELIDLGEGNDLPFCGQVDITDIVPIYKNGVIGASS